jgi:NTF2-like protein (DUF6841)
MTYPAALGGNGAVLNAFAAERLAIPDGDRAQLKRIRPVSGPGPASRGRTLAVMAAAPVWSVIVDNNSLSQWFGEYANAFVACGRGENDAASLLAYYGVPLLLTTDDGFFALTTGDQVVAAAQQQIDAMRAAGYARSQILDSRTTILNSTTALYHQTFSRHRSDGSEISRGTTTYLVTDGPAGRRISVLAMHSP